MKRHAASWGLALILGLSIASGGCSDKADKDNDDDKSDSDSDKKKDKDKGDKKSGDKPADAKNSAAPGDTAKPAPTQVASPATVGSKAAYLHLGTDCELAIITDLEKIMGHPAFARDVTPKLRELLQKPSSDAKAAKMQAWAKDVGFTEKSPQALAVCMRNFSAPDPSFGVLFGTDLKPGSFQSIFDKINETATKKLVLTDVGGVKVGQKDNVTFGQLSDGVIAIADTSNTFMTLIPSADNVAKFKLDTSKAISLFVSAAVLKKLDKPGSKGNEFVTGINEITGYLDMVTNKAVFRAACKSEEEAKKLQGIANVLSTSDDMKKKAAGAPMGAGEILKSMTARVEGKDVVIEVTIPSSSIDEAAKLISQELDKALKNM